MKLLVVLVLFIFAAAAAKASVIVNPVNPLTYSVPAVPVATSYQAVSRNVNRVIVPRVPSITNSIAYPGYVGGWGNYPYNYRPGYGYGYPYGHVHNYGYGYGYPYGYGAAIW